MLHKTSNIVKPVLKRQPQDHLLSTQNKFSANKESVGFFFLKKMARDIQEPLMLVSV